MYAKKTVSMKLVVLLLAIVLLIGCTIGGTLAWLISTTGEVKNTFSAAGIEVTLTETETGPYLLVPGKEHAKNPTVTVNDEKTNVDCYLFVRFDETGDPSTYLEYTSTLTTGNEWALVNGTTNVWWRLVETTDETKSWELLDGNKVTVKTTVTEENMADAAQATLTYQAYAIQYEGFESNVAGAWAEVSGANSTP